MSEADIDRKEAMLQDALNELTKTRNSGFIGKYFQSSVWNDVFYKIISMTEDGVPLVIEMRYDKQNPAIAYNEECDDIVPSEDVEITEETFSKVMNQVLAILTKHLYDEMKKK